MADIFLKSDDRYYALGHAREGAKKWLDCFKITHPDIYFEEVHATAYLVVAPLAPGEDEFDADASLEIIFAYYERAMQHMRGRAGDWTDANRFPCNEIGTGFPMQSIQITFLPGES